MLLLPKTLNKISDVAVTEMSYGIYYIECWES